MVTLYSGEQVVIEAIEELRDVRYIHHVESDARLKSPKRVTLVDELKIWFVLN